MPKAMDRSFKTDLSADEAVSGTLDGPSAPAIAPALAPALAFASDERQVQQENHLRQDLTQKLTKDRKQDLTQKLTQDPTQKLVQGDHGVRPNTGDRRKPRDDRRNSDDRRSNSLRRGRDRQRNASANQIAYLGTMLCALSVGVAIYAFLKPPISFTPSLKCAEGFGGQQVERRGLSSLWAVAMVLAAAGLVIPDRKRRPVVLMVLCGVSVGLFAAAYFTVGTKLVGFCID